MKAFFLNLVLCTLTGLAASPAFAGDAASTAAVATAPIHVVIQVSDNDPGKWNLALNNANNILADSGKIPADVEIVAFGPGVRMLLSDSPVGGRVAEAEKNGVHVEACENTMHHMKLTDADMLFNIGYVPSGAVEIIRRQQQGYAYLRP